MDRINTRMGINRFFTDVLRASPVNPRWSWGAVDDRNRHVLRVWSNERSHGAKYDRILVLNRKDRASVAAQNERERHLDMSQSGYQLFGVQCIPSHSTNANAGRIGSFDSQTLLQLGQLRQEDNRVFADILGSVSIGELQDSHMSSLLNDIEVVKSDPTLTVTTRKALIDARMGQGRFRRALKQRYGAVCSVTGCAVDEILRASHIKSWARSTDKERLDPHNGLLLVPTIDALFDRGLISFNENGHLELSNLVPSNELMILGLLTDLRRAPSQKQKGYLAYHRNHVFRLRKS